MFLLSYFSTNFKNNNLTYYSFSKQPIVFLSTSLWFLPHLLSLYNLNLLRLSSLNRHTLQNISNNYTYILFFKQKIYFLFKLFKYIFLSYKSFIYYRWLFFFFLNIINSGATFKNKLFFKYQSVSFFNKKIIKVKIQRKPIFMLLSNKPSYFIFIKFVFFCSFNLKRFLFFFYSIKFYFLFSRHISQFFIKNIFFSSELFIRCALDLAYVLDSNVNLAGDLANFSVLARS